MCTDNFTITKRDGKKEKFSLDKIKSAILKAFSAVGQPIDNEGLQKVMEHLRFCNGMSVEDIQNQVEVALMAERHFKVAKTFMLYRKQHEDDRLPRAQSSTPTQMLRTRTLPRSSANCQSRASYA